jgi:CRISPR system Cascade subunit CasE
MFLSRFGINTARRGARFLLGNPQAMHAAVMSSFPPDQQPAGSRVLWRVDREAHVANLYVLSPTEPDFTHLVEQAGWATATWDTRGYDQLLERIQTGQHWGFRLQANPVKQSNDPLTKGKRLPHVTPAQQSQWLADRAERNGFAIATSPDGTPALQVSSRTKTAFGRNDRHHPGSKAKVTLVRAQFDGILQVTDQESFRAALTNGIGRAKAYGCGLMTIVRASGDG